MTPLSAREFKCIDPFWTDVSCEGNLVGTSSQSQQQGRTWRQVIGLRPR